MKGTGAVATRILTKELIQKEDGRYLYLYSWAKEKPVKARETAKQHEGDPGPEQTKGRKDC